MPGWEDKTDVASPPVLPTGAKRENAYLVVMAGSSVGEMYKLGDDVTVIGRGQRAQLRLMDDGISREHARVVVEDDRIFLEDLGARNGTFCNSVRVTRTELRDGDKILIGTSTVLKFTYRDEVDETFQRQMYESALRDRLTKSFNRKYLLDRLESEVAYAIRHTAPLALIMLDIDRFKQINESFGSHGGDRVLSELSQRIASTLRTEDVFARFGGEEFAVICRGIDLGMGQIVAERLRKMAAGKPFAFEGRAIAVTVSLGVAALPSAAITDAAGLVTAADEALREAKNAGRNRVGAKGE